DRRLGSRCHGDPGAVTTRLNLATCRTCCSLPGEDSNLGWRHQKSRSCLARRPGIGSLQTLPGLTRHGFATGTLAAPHGSCALVRDPAPSDGCRQRGPPCTDCRVVSYCETAGCLPSV